MVIWSQPSASTKIWDFKNSLLGHYSNYFTILLIYKTQPYPHYLRNFERFCFKNFRQPWTKLVEKSSKSSKFQKWLNSSNSEFSTLTPSPPPMSILLLAMFYCARPKTLHWIWLSFVVKSLSFGVKSCQFFC